MIYFHQQGEVGLPHRRGFWIEHPLDQVWPRRLLGIHQNWAFRKPLKDIGVGLLNPFLSTPFSLINLFLFIASSPINWGMYILHALILEVLILKGYKFWITGCHELPQSVLFFLYFLFPSLFSFHDFYDPKMKSLKYDSFYFSTTTRLYFIYFFFFWELIVVLVMIWFLFFLSFFITILGLYVIDK